MGEPYVGAFDGKFTSERSPLGLFALFPAKKPRSLPQKQLLQEPAVNLIDHDAADPLQESEVNSTDDSEANAAENPLQEPDVNSTDHSKAEAENAMKSKVKEEDFTPDEFNEMGLANHHSERYELAVQMYSTAIELSLSSAIPIRINRVASYYKWKKWPKVIDECEILLALDSSNVEARYYKGLVYQQQRQFKKAIDSYTEAIKFAKESHHPFEEGISTLLKRMQTLQQNCLNDK